MTEDEIKTVAIELYRAFQQCSPMAPPTSTHPDIQLADAYKIQMGFLEARLAASGERVIGKKIGVTSKAVQEMLRVFQPDFGLLTSGMQFLNGEVVSLTRAGLIQPRAEAEIAFMLKADLPTSSVTKEQVLEATDWVCPCFEIVDSRIKNWNIKIQDTVADNASCGVFVLGTQRTQPRSIDLAAVTMQMQKNGQQAGSGTGAAVQGHPAEAVAWLANTLGEFGIPFRAGEIILSGALSPLVPVVAGDTFTMQIEGLGDCSIAFSE